MLPAQLARVFIGEYKTPEDLGEVIDLGQLVEEDEASGGGQDKTAGLN